MRIRIRYCEDRGCLHECVGRSTLFFPPTLGLTIRVEGRRQRFTSKDKKGCTDECSSGGQVLIVFRSRVPLGAAATTPPGATGAAVSLAPHVMSYLRSPASTMAKISGERAAFGPKLETGLPRLSLSLFFLLMATHRREALLPRAVRTVQPSP